MSDLSELNRFEKEESLKHLKITWTYNSNAIEGNSLSYGDTQFIIENGLTVKGKPLKDHNEVVGHAKAIDIVYGLIEKDEIGCDDIFNLHRAIQTNIVIDIDCPIGAYKVVENGRMIRVDGKLRYFPYPDSSDVPYLMELWFEQFGVIKKLQSFDECVDAYTDIHIAFTAIHPFFDGNGRVARLISNLSLLKSGYLPIIIDTTDRQEYINLLSGYNLAAKPLDKTAKTLLEKNKTYYELREFFKDQYKNSKELLDAIRSKR